MAAYGVVVVAGGGSVVAGGGSFVLPGGGPFFFVSVGAGAGAGAPKNSYWPWKGFHTTGLLGAPQSGGGCRPNAPVMKMRQIVAGKVPPTTRMPCTLVIGIFAFG